MSTPLNDRDRTRAQHHGMLAAHTPGRPVLSRLERDPLAVLLAALLLFLLLALVLASLWLHSATHVFPGVESLGVALGGRSRAEGVAALERAWQERAVALADGDRVWSLPPEGLGLRLDAQQVVDVALGIGDPAAHLRALLSGAPPIQVTPAVTIDRARMEAQLRALAPQVAVAPIDATLRVTGARVEQSPSVPGRALDVGATADWIGAHLLELAEGAPAPLAFSAVQAPVTNLDALEAEANAWLSNPVTIRAFDPIAGESLWWTAEPDVWASWVTLAYDPGPPPALRWSVERERVRAYLAGRAGELGASRYYLEEDVTDDVAAAILSGEFQVTFRVYHHPGQHVVQAGETLASIARDRGFPYPWLQEANPGVDRLRPGQTIAIPSPDVLLPLPVVMHKRIVVSISQQQMWAYEWGNVVWAWTVSTGIPSSPTSPGVFQVQSHEREAYAASWDLWMPYFVGIYRPVPSSRFMNGFHGFPTRDGATLLWTGNLGYPVTYGCILLSTQNAALLYDWAEEGVVVEIRP
ncbi:MAG: L,D-transpeptidase family protein [Anaerolineae bacterium]|nr:L,D-transpeptidase family protein [Anaerolineae bacterium]